MIDFLLFAVVIGVGLYYFKPDIFSSLAQRVESSPVAQLFDQDKQPGPSEAIKSLAGSLDPVKDAEYIAFLYTSVLPLAMADTEGLKDAIRAANATAK